MAKSTFSSFHKDELLCLYKLNKLHILYARSIDSLSLNILVILFFEIFSSGNYRILNDSFTSLQELYLKVLIICFSNST